MADLGAIGTSTPGFAKAVKSGIYGLGVVGYPEMTGTAAKTGFLRTVNFGCNGTCDLRVGVFRNDTEGSPASPCLEIDRQQYFPIKWPVVGGVDNTFSIKVKQPVAATLRPRVVIRADASINVNSDVVGVAEAGAGWVVIGPLTVTPNAFGVLEIRLENRSDAADQRSYWDGIEVTPGAPVGTFSFWKDNAPVFIFGEQVSGGGTECSFSFTI